MNKLRSVLKSAWIIVAACVAVFFVVALVVYAKAEPNSVSDILIRDGTWVRTEELLKSTDDIEKYPYVTKVYTYESDKPRLYIDYIKGENDDDIDYGIIEDPSLPCNYRVEFFVFSDYADKKLVKRLWNMSVDETDMLTFKKTNIFYNVTNHLYESDLKKRDTRGSYYYLTFIKITVKPGFEATFDTIAENGDS